MLLAVTTLTEEIKAGVEANGDIFRFEMLPLIAVKPPHPWALDPPFGTRITPYTETSYAVAWAINRALLEASHLSRTWAPNGNRWAVGLDDTPSYVAMGGDDGTDIRQYSLIENVRIAHPAALNLSLQLRPGRALAEDDVLSIATRAASRVVPVVVAAGNWGNLGEGTLSPLANLPWTIAAGATSDEAGTERLATSSVGVPGSDSHSGPTVVAYGEDSFAPGTFATSFAAPRVTTQVLVLTAFVLQMRQIEVTRCTGLLGGIPLLHAMSVDTGFEGFDPSPDLPLPMIPRGGVDQAAVLSAIELLEDSGARLAIEPTPEIIRRMLVDSARPMPGHDPAEVGAGFVSTQTTVEYMRSFNALDFAKLFVEEPCLDDSLRNALEGMRLADSARLDCLEEVARRSALRYAVDWRTGSVYASMRDPGMHKEEHGYTKEPSRYSWPPAV